MTGNYDSSLVPVAEASGTYWTTSVFQQKTLDFAEKYADGKATVGELRGGAWGKSGPFNPIVWQSAIDAANGAAQQASDRVEWLAKETEYPEETKEWRDRFDAAWKDHNSREATEIANASASSEWLALGERMRSIEHAAHADNIRDIFGNPFRSGQLDLGAVSTVTVKMARDIYERGEFDLVSELAAAFDASDPRQSEAIEHCRQSKLHIRGCWVVDLLLGYE